MDHATTGQSAASTDVRSLIQYSPGGVMSKVIAKSPKTNITLFCMAAGTDISEHTATREGTVHVLEGNGTFTLDGHPIPMRDGTLIRMAANQRHSIVANDDTAFLLILIG